MDIHKETVKDLKNRLPLGDEIDSVESKLMNEFEDKRLESGTDPQPLLPLTTKIKE